MNKVCSLYKTLSLCLVVVYSFFIVLEPLAFAGYSGKSVESGTVDVSVSGDITTFTTSDHAIANFDSFSVDLNENYVINSASTLFHVTGPSFTDISGSLTSYGQF